MKVGFAEIDITPEYFPIRTYLGEVNEILDPIYAHAVVFNDGEKIIAWLSLDIVILEWEYVKEIRDAIFEKTGIPQGNILLN